MKSITNFLTKCREGIHNAINDAGLSAKLAAYGYDSAKLNEGKVLYETAQQLDDEQRNLHAKEKQCFADYETARKQLHQTYLKHLKVARVAFKGNLQAYNDLLLSGSRNQKFDKWEQQCGAFYKGLSNDAGYQAAFNIYIAQSEVTAAATDLVHVLELHEIYLIASGDAQNKTEMRNVALKNLDSWYSDFIKIARIACGDSPQYLEKLGIKG